MFLSRYLDCHRCDGWSIAGYFGGWRDRTLMWIVDLLLVVPELHPGRDITPRLGLVRSRLLVDRAVLGIRLDDQLTYRARHDDEPAGARIRMAARYMGVSNTRIILRHILPNVASLLIIDTLSTSVRRSWPKPG